ncbi:MAG: phage head morphogenesis protein [Alkaliphilus sp.]|jgi:SPP1 gp7 family putative phage head morphogenesis protein|nr:MAG: phage head morphogenesis protein [Alkaliphilus sp.]
MKDLIKLLRSPLKFEEAIEYFGEKLPVSPKEFYSLAEKYRASAFTVSGYSQVQVLNKFHGALLTAIEEGTTMEQFKKDMNKFLDEKGYTGITNFQADNIFRTNAQTAYSVGHYKQITDPTVVKLRPFWMYDAVDDRKTRLTHRAMDQKVYRADDPVWDVWYPPNGFKCRCGVVTLSERQVKQRNIKVEEGMPGAGVVEGTFVNILPDRNFRTNPAKISFKPDLKGYPETLKKAFERRELK